MFGIKLWLAAVAAGVLLASNASAQQILLNEKFEDYANTAELQAVWTLQTSANVTAANNLALDTNGFVPTFAPKGDATFAPNPFPTIPHSPDDSVNTLTEVSKLGRFNGPTSGSNPVSAYRSLSAPVTGSFTVQADMIMETYGRNVGFAMFNAAGTSGYVFRWQGTNVNQNSGRGVIQLYRYASSTNTPFDASLGTGNAVYAGDIGVDLGNHTGNTTRGVRPAYGVDATTNVPNENDPEPWASTAAPNSLTPVSGYSRRSGNDAATSTTIANNNFAAEWQGISTFTLVFNPNVTRENQFTNLMETGGQLLVYVNSPENPNQLIPIFDVIDPTPLDSLSFERFYVFGRHSNIDNILVSVPEPASMSLAGLFGMFLLRRRRREVH